MSTKGLSGQHAQGLLRIISASLQQDAGKMFDMQFASYVLLGNSRSTLMPCVTCFPLPSLLMPCMSCISLGMNCSASQKQLQLPHSWLSAWA